MKRILLTTAILILAWLTFFLVIKAHAVTGIYGATCRTGASACVDGIDVTDPKGDNSDIGLAAGDICIVVMDAGSTEPELYVYRLYDSGTAESDPNIIKPDYTNGGAYSGNLRWHLVNFYGKSLNSSGSATPGASFYDSDCTDDDKNGYIYLNCTDTGSGTEDCDFYFQQQIAGTLTTWLQADADGSLDFQARNMLTTGTVAGLMPTVVENTATTYSVTQAQARANTYFLNTYAGTKTFVLPAAEAGMAVCIRQGQGVTQILRVDTDGTDYIVMSTGARTSAAGDYYGATAHAKNQICLVAFDATDWYVTSEVGTWTEE